MQNSKKIGALAILLIGGFLLMNHSQKPVPAQSAPAADASLPIGTTCAIEVRPPLPSSLSSLRLTGKLKAANDKWIVIDTDFGSGKSDVWVSRDSVLWIVTGKAAETYEGVPNPFSIKLDRGKGK